MLTPHGFADRKDTEQLRDHYNINIFSQLVKRHEQVSHPQKTNQEQELPHESPEAAKLNSSNKVHYSIIDLEDHASPRESRRWLNSSSLLWKL
jgi:hypothetical protein